MRRLLILILALSSLLLIFPARSSATVQVVAYLMTKPQPPSCAVAVANNPPAYTTFSTTDPVAYLWFYLTGTNPGDVIATEYYTPAGQYYAAASGAFDPLTAGGNWCFVDTAFEIAGHTPATIPGTWTVLGIYNGNILFTLKFTIVQGTAACTFAISPTSASVVAAGGTGSATMTAGSGCSWSAASSVSWITTTSSGSGNGAINYSVAANTATSARTGAIAAGGQTLTISQAAASSSPPPATGNLVVNGDAESGAATTDYSGLKSIPGWTTDGNVTVFPYSIGGGYPDTSSPGPANRGKNFFGGGSVTTAVMSQNIDLSASSSAIDGGSQPYTLDAWLGGYDGQNDSASVQATFKSSTGATLATATVGPALSADRNGVTGFVEKTATGKVPSGARSVTITVTFTRTDGNTNDGCADNISFTLTGSGATPTSGTPVYYRFENGTANATASGAGSVLDSSGSGQNGTPSGGLTYSSDVPLTTVGGASNGLSLNFTSTGSVQFPGVFPLNTLANATMEFYIKPAPGTSENDFLWTRLDSSDANRFNMGVTNGGTGRAIFLDYREPGGALHSLCSIPVASTSWTHVAAVKSGNVWTCYANGVQQGQPYTDLVPNLPTNTGWTFNGRGSPWFAGLIDEFKITASVLTPSQFLAPVGSSGLNLTINQVIDSACPSDRVIVSVTDSSGKPVTGLSASNFTLKEGGSARTITVFPVSSGSASGALNLAVLVDTSGSMSTTDIANEKAAAKQLVSQLGSSDQMAVYTFESSVHLLQDFTSDKTKLNAAIDSITGGNMTALYQAVQTAATALGSRTGRKAIVLMTDGEDTASTTTMGQAITAAKTAGAPVFTVGFGSADQSVLTQIATQTGGFYSASSTSANLQSILQSIGQVISSQYEIDYTSQLPTTDNQVDITVAYNGQTATASRTVSKCSNSSGGGTGCSYFLQPQSLSVPAAGQSGTIIVQTQAGCTVAATSNVAWIHIVGSSAGAVSYQVDANTGAARGGVITIGNRTVNVTQDGAVSCTYSLSPPGNTVGALGGSSSVRLTTGAGCPWTAAATGSGWFHLNSAASGAGMVNLNYTADANTNSQTRTATIIVAGLTFTLTQQAGSPPNTPSIADNGIVNAASNRAGTVARGSFFTIYGANLGPAPYQQVQGYPIPDTMGGVVVTVSQGSYSKRAFLHFVSPPQINAILPSDAPLGDVHITVTYNGVVSSTSTVTVANTAFGNFSAQYGVGPGIVQNFNSATDQPLNLQSSPLKPKQIAILWGTGLGPISTPDNTPPPGGNLSIPVQVSVGGKSANVLYSGRAPSFAGVDNIYYEVPQDAPTGCSVPVQVNAGGVVSNTVRVAISADGSKCQDSVAPFANTLTSGAKNGTIGLIRLALTGTIDSSKGSTNSTVDVGVGYFANTAAGGELAFNPFFNIHPIGTCAQNTQLTDAGGVISSSGLAFDKTGSTQLDAGTQITVTGPKGTQQIQHFDPNTAGGPYITTIGGAAPVDGAPSLPLFLDPGSYTITGAGGKDVGAFTASLTVPQPVTWTNAPQIASINRSTPLTITWSGGDPSQTVMIGGGSTDQKTKKSGGFVCLVPANAGTFTIPTSALGDLVPTGNTISASDSEAILFLASTNMATPPTFTAPGLTAGRLFYTYMTARAVPIQ